MRNTLNTAVLTLSIFNFNIDINDDYIFMRHTWDPYAASEYRKRVPDREKPNLQQWISPPVCISIWKAQTTIMRKGGPSVKIHEAPVKWIGSPI